MTMKSLLLGAAAGLVTVGAAHAADLPMTKAEAVEYVKVCTEFGEGFYYIPGTDTCLRISGEVRADYRFYQYDHRADDAYDFTTEGRVKFDARTQTEYGLLRSFFQINARAGNINGGGDGASDFSIDKAFIQFGGLTAGYAHTFFGIYDNDYANTIFASYYTSQSTVNLIAYTAAFGGGFTATVALEDGGEHEGAGTILSDPGTSPLGPVRGYSGKRTPDLVANLRVDQEWGKASIFGAVHQVRYPYSVADDDWGWAAGGALAVNAPGFPGLYAVVEAVYESGASNYVGLSEYDGAFDGYGLGAGDSNLSDAWSVTGEIGYAITPQLTFVAFGSYVDFSGDSAGDGVWKPADFNKWTVGANATYTIVKDLTIGAEVSYTKQDFDDDEFVVNGEDNDAWQGGVRIKRTF